MSSRSKRPWQYVGLGALVVLNVVLVAILVLRPTTPEIDESEAVPGALPSAEEPTPAPTKELPAELATATGDVDPNEAEPAERLLVNADAFTAWRAVVGDCTEPGRLERSDDGGETWQELPADLAPVSRMRVLGTQSLFAIGGGADCEPTYLSSSTGGASWQSNDQFLEGSWYLLPDDRNSLAAPVGEVPTPCEPVDLAALDASSAAVLCTDGSLELTDDGGATWSSTSLDMDALAIGTTDDGFVLAGTGEACDDGTAVTLTDVAAEELTSGCADATPADPTELAVSAANGAVWLWAGNDVLVSADGGQTW